MSEDPIKAAVRQIDTDAEPDHAEPDADDLELTDEPTDAEPDHAEPQLPSDGDDSGFSVLSWARRVPDGSHTDFDARDWWDPNGGGIDRMAFHLSDASNDGAGYPNALGFLVGAVEAYADALDADPADWLTGGGGGDDGADADVPDAETVDRATAEAHV